MNRENIQSLLMVFSCGFVLMLHIGLAATYPLESDSSEESIPSLKANSPVGRDNGMLKLVLHDLTERMIRDMEENVDTKLSDLQMGILRNQIIGFYKEILHHPALNSDRVMFSSQKPDFKPSMQPEADSSLLEEDGNALVENDTNLRVKKREEPFQEVCRSSSEWVQLSHGLTRSGDRVALYEDQYYHVTTCLHSRQPCTGIDSAYSSRCLAKPSWNIAYIWSEEDNQYKWDWISIDTCCSCRIQQD